MKYTIILVFALFSLSANAQFSQNNQKEVVSDSSYLEYRPSDSTFLRVNRIDYSDGSFFVSATSIGDSAAVRRSLEMQYLQVGDQVAAVTVAYNNRNREERKQRSLLQTYTLLFGNTLQESIADTYGFSIVGNYRITSTVAGFALDRVNCTIERQGRRLRLLIPNQTAFVLSVDGNNAMVLARGTGSNAVRHALFRQAESRVWRNETGSITLTRRQ